MRLGAILYELRLNIVKIGHQMLLDAYLFRIMSPGKHFLRLNTILISSASNRDFRLSRLAAVLWMSACERHFIWECAPNATLSASKCGFIWSGDYLWFYQLSRFVVYRVSTWSFSKKCLHWKICDWTRFSFETLLHTNDVLSEPWLGAFDTSNCDTNENRFTAYLLPKTIYAISYHVSKFSIKII